MALRNHSNNYGRIVSDIAAELYDGLTYDHALPQPFVDRMRQRGFDPFGRVVWLYPAGDPSGLPAPLDVEAYVELMTP